MASWDRRSGQRIRERVLAEVGGVRQADRGLGLVGRGVTEHPAIPLGLQPIDQLRTAGGRDGAVRQHVDPIRLKHLEEAAEVGDRQDAQAVLIRGLLDRRDTVASASTSSPESISSRTA